MNLPPIESFRSKARAEGFAEVVERHWEPRAIVGTHRHPFEASALVVRGEMWLTVAGATQHLMPGGRFELAAGVPHEER